MYYLWTDKPEIFEAKIDITGATYADTECRLVIETGGWNLMSEGVVSSEGKCEIPISKMKSHLREGDTGKMRLEVIIEGDVFFVPFETEYEVKTSRKAVVEVLSQKKEAPSRNRIQVKAIPAKTKPSPENILENITRDSLLIKGHLDAGNKDEAKLMLKKMWDSYDPEYRSAIKNAIRSING